MIKGAHLHINNAIILFDKIIGWNLDWTLKLWRIIFGNHHGLESLQK